MANEAMLGCCFMIAAPMVLFLISSWGTLNNTEVALRKNWVFQKVSPDVETVAGLKLLFPWNELIKYPSTSQGMSFSASDRDLLDGRTSDGLPLVLGVSFQYTLNKDELFKLYMEYEAEYGDYIKMYKLMGIHILTEMATNYSAYQFFNEKQKIASEMQVQMNDYFYKHLHANITSLQINEDDLPDAFTDMILKSATMKQNISKTLNVVKAAIIQMQTSIKVAQAQANVTIQNAVGQSSAIEQNGKADASVITSFVSSELEAYSNIKDKLGLKGNDLLKYIWYDAIGGGSVIEPGHDFSVFSGVNPGAYIQPGASAQR